MRSPLVVASVGVHVVAVSAFFVAGFWNLDRLEPGRRTFDLAVAPPLPAAAAAGGESAHTADPFKKKRPPVTKDIVQPPKLKIETEVTRTSEEPGTGTGTGSGSGIGSGSGTDPAGTGTCTEEPCGPPAAPVVVKKDPPVVPQIVPPTVIKGMRTAGDTQIHPPAPVKTAIMRDGKTKVTAVYRVCVGTDGEISSLSVVKSSGYAGYDAALDDGLRGWRYRPYVIDGRKVPVCGVVTFIYSIQ